MWFRKICLQIVWIGMLTFNGHNSYAQTKDFLESFNISQSNGKVFLTWTIRAGNICVGIEVLRSVDSTNFDLIGGVEGVCGNLSFASNYSFIDKNPEINKVNYYKLNLGGEGFSEVLSIEIFDITDKGYLIFPHPLSDFSKIHFNNDSGLLTTITVYSMSGKLIYMDVTNLNYFELYKDLFEKGHYLFQLSSELESAPITGKIIVIQ